MNAKYTLDLSDTIVIAPGRTLKRIRALVAITTFSVLPGDSGGYIEAEACLSVSGNAWVSGNARNTPLQLGGLRWPVTLLDADMQIGCQFHPLTTWAAFTDAEITEMDGRAALRFWRDHREVVLGLARATGRLADSAPERAHAAQAAKDVQEGSL